MIEIVLLLMVCTFIIAYKAGEYMGERKQLNKSKEERDEPV
jgi:hypothetical protein